MSIKQYRIDVGSPIDYEEVVVYIVINGQDTVLLQKEEGIDKVKVEFIGFPTKQAIYYDAFIEALQAAKEELLK